jgi:hypothetical protein
MSHPKTDSAPRTNPWVGAIRKTPAEPRTPAQKRAAEQIKLWGFDKKIAAKGPTQ